MLPKQKLTSYESALTSLIFGLIALVLEGFFIYQYFTTETVKFSPTAIISGDGAFYFVIIMGLFAFTYFPYALKKFIKALADD